MVTICPKRLAKARFLARDLENFRKADMFINLPSVTYLPSVQSEKLAWYYFHFPTLFMAGRVGMDLFSLCS